MERLEQIRLPDSVGTGYEHDPGNEFELQLGIGAKVSERNVGDDQPASLIGMIR